MKQRPPKRQTRQRIERDLAGQREVSGARRREAAKVEEHLTKLRDNLNPAAFARVEEQFRKGVRRISVELKRRKRRPREGGMPAFVEPPRGPGPLSGGAAAALEFE